MHPAERKARLCRLAELIEACGDEQAVLESMDTQAHIRYKTSGAGCARNRRLLSLARRGRGQAGGRGDRHRPRRGQPDVREPIGVVAAVLAV
jgi:acyl-CoA reductase-like NAD-dependent aldehyde dehydrogenase